MSENSLVAKIKADAATAAAAVAAESAAAVAAVERETEAKLTALREAYAAAQKKQHEQLELVAVSRAKQAGRIALQQAKRDEIDAVFATAIAELVAQPSAQYETYYSKLVSALVPSGVTVTKVYAPENRLAETAAILVTAGLAGTVEPRSSITAGLLIETEDGVYDCTLDRLLKEQRAELEMQIIQQVTAS